MYENDVSEILFDLLDLTSGTQLNLMLVFTMTPGELNKELHNDFAYIRSQRLQDLGESYIRERKNKKIKKEEQYPVFTEIRTRSRNNWIILFNKRASAERFKGPEDISMVFLCYISSDKGIRYFKVNPGGEIIIYNQHFFNRYNQRMELGLNNHLDIVKDFFTYNGYAAYKILSDEPINEDIDDKKIDSFGVCNDGYILSVRMSKYKWVINRTFIRKDQAFTDQEDLEAETLIALESQLNNYILNNDDSLDALELRDLLKGIK